MLESTKIQWLLLKRGLDRSLHRHLGLFLKPAYNAAPKDQSRRNLLKIAGLGLGALVVGKIVGDRLFSPSGTQVLQNSLGLAEAKPRAGKGSYTKHGSAYWKQTFLFSD